MVVRLTSARAERTRWARRRRCAGTAHLRSRGEDARSWTLVPVPIGSPPLARRLHRRGPSLRLTSARAEKTAYAATRRAAPPAYLRSREEDAVLVLSAMCKGGSPPFARRGRDVDVRRGQIRRLTSARAERACGLSSPSTGGTAHLCLRGEGIETDFAKGTTGDSPPLAEDVDRNARLTPPARRTSATCTPSTRAIGSPPLARRGRHADADDAHRDRLTSARAERTAGSTRSRPPSTAYPRSHGEGIELKTSTIPLYGSPPLARRGLSGT